MSKFMNIFFLNVSQQNIVFKLILFFEINSSVFIANIINRKIEYSDIIDAIATPSMPKCKIKIK